MEEMNSDILVITILTQTLQLKDIKRKNTKDLKSKDRKRYIRQTLIYFYLEKANKIITYTTGEATLTPERYTLEEGKHLKIKILIID